MSDRITELEEDNRRLRRLLDQRDAPGELRHRLRSTLSLLRAVLRRSAATKRDLLGFVAHLEDRLDAIARAQALADQYGEVDLRVLLADEMFHYGAKEGESVVFSGPDVRLQSRAGQLLGLALHELAANAVEHGVLGTDAGRVAVSWNVTDTASGTTMLLTWAERGGPPIQRPARHGFGAEVLLQMLPYDLNAVTELVIEPPGLRCTMQLPFPAHVGRVVQDAL